MDVTRNRFLEEIKCLYNSKLYWTLVYFSFCNYRVYFCFCIFAWYSYRNYKFCNSVKICEIAAGIEKYKLIIKEKKKKKKHDKVVLLAKSKLNNIEVLISKALIVSNTNNLVTIIILKIFKLLFQYALLFAVWLVKKVSTQT